MGTARPVHSGDGTASRLLGIYLNDHLSGATAGVELSRRMAAEYRGTGLGRELESLWTEISRDRQSLLGLMASLGVPVRRYKIYGAWVGEKIGRLKLNGRLRRRSPLSTVLELEVLLAGVEGKAMLWRALFSAASHDPRLEVDRFQQLLDRALQQMVVLRSLHEETTSVALVSGDTPGDRRQRTES